MPDACHFPHEVVDHLTDPAGPGRDANEFHTAGFGEKAGPVEVVFAGQHAQLRGACSGALLDEIQGKMEVFPGGCSLVLHPDPFRVNAEGYQLITHGQCFCHGLVIPLAAGDNGGHIGVGFQIVVCGVDPVPEGGGRSGDPGLCSQDHYVIHGFLRISKTGLDNDALGDTHHGNADYKTDGEHPPNDWNNGGEGGEQHPGDLVKGENSSETAAHQRGKAVAPEHEFQREGRSQQHRDQAPGQNVKLLHKWVLLG